jgi:XTP/dITP diphosphohydrolase
MPHRLEALSWQGVVKGLIHDQAQGHNGFGYDPIFYYPPFKLTFGEMDDAAKNRVSHRAEAAKAMRADWPRILEFFRSPRESRDLWKNSRRALIAPAEKNRASEKAP